MFTLHRMGMEACGLERSTQEARFTNRRASHVRFCKVTVNGVVGNILRIYYSMNDFYGVFFTNFGLINTDLLKKKTLSQRRAEKFFVLNVAR